MITGNDLSQFQGDVGFDVFKNNANFVIVKTTEGTGFIDPKFKRNQSEARRVGLPLGYYHFARPDLGNAPEREADDFLAVCGQLQAGEVLALDYEPQNQKPEDVLWCLNFLNRIQSKTQVKPFIYLNQAQVKKFNWKPVADADYALWIAAYTYDPANNNFLTGAWPSAVMQQWTDVQSVPGIPNKADADGDVFFGDVNTFKKYGYNPVTPVPPQTDYKARYEKAQNKLDRIKGITNE